MVRLAAVLPTSRRAATKMALRGENINRAQRNRAGKSRQTILIFT
jgi:hypothetical protein